MPDLDDRFGDLDRIPAPDLWEQLRTRRPRDHLGPARTGRVVAGLTALALAATGLGLVFITFRGVERPDDVGSPSPASEPSDGLLVFEAWSPQSEDEEHFAVSPEGGPTISLGRLSQSGLEWSPDGARIVYVVGGDLWLADADGSDARPLTSGPQADSGPAWSPDGTRIAFEREGSIAVVDVEGGAPVEVVPRIERTPQLGPAWSPDGRTIAFSRPLIFSITTSSSCSEKENFRAGDIEFGLFAVEVESGEVRRLTGGKEDLDPSWSPDGSRIVYSGGGRLCSVAADGTDQRPFLPPCDCPDGDSQPLWSRDGETVAFLRGGGVWLASEAGGDARPLLVDRTLHAESLAWPPADAAIPVSGATSSSAEAEGVRCTATVETPIVDPGDEAVVRFVIENGASKPVWFEPRYGESLWFDVRDAARLPVWRKEDQSVYEGPPPPRTEVVPGGTGEGTARVVVRWGGPLALEPVGSFARDFDRRSEALRLSPLRLDVRIPGPTPDADDAIRAAVAATDGLFDSCVPSAEGSHQVGVLRVTAGSQPYSMDARCSAKVRAYEGFVDVTLEFVWPLDAPDFEFPRDPLLPEVPGDGPLELGRWSFVVTAEGAREVGHLESVGRVEGAVATVSLTRHSGSWSANCSDRDGMGFIFGGGAGVVMVLEGPCP